MSTNDTRPCGACLTGTARGKHARFCEQCLAQKRTKPAKYAFTAQLDETLRKAYETRERLTRTLTLLAKETGWPRHTFRARAQQLGWKGGGRLVAIFREAGFPRSLTSIEVKRKRLRIGQNVNGYTAHALAQMLGVDSHKVTRWIRFGWLKARSRGTSRTEQQGGDMVYIARSAVRRFILAHPMEISPGRADWLWLLDVVTDGKVGADLPAERGASEDSSEDDDEQEAA